MIVILSFESFWIAPRTLFLVHWIGRRADHYLK